MSKYYNGKIPMELHIIYADRYTGKNYYTFKKLKEENKRLKKTIYEIEKFLEDHEATFILREVRKIKEKNNGRNE